MKKILSRLAQMLVTVAGASIARRNARLRSLCCGSCRIIIMRHAISRHSILGKSVAYNMNLC